MKKIDESWDLIVIIGFCIFLFIAALAVASIEKGL